MSDVAGDSTDATGSEDTADNSTDTVGVEDAEEGDGDAGEGVADVGPDAVVDADDASDTGDAEGSPDTSSELRCTIPSVVDAEVVVDTGCPPIESEGVSVVRGGRLVLNPGVEVRFARGALLVVEGAVS